MPENFIIKIMLIPEEMALHEVLKSIRSEIKSVLSIFRVYNYKEQKRVNDIIVIMRDVFEYKELRQKQVLWIGGQYLQLVFNDWQVSAGFTALSPSPKSLKISGLIGVSKVTTVYLIKLLTAFEAWAGPAITGISVIYDGWRDSIRPFGFVAFNSIDSMIPFHNRFVTLFEETLQCEISNRVPVLASNAKKKLLELKPLVLTQELCDVNELNINPLKRSESQLSLIAGLNAISLNENANINTPTIDEPQNENIGVSISDTDSVLSLDIDIDFDENMNLIRKKM